MFYHGNNDDSETSFVIDVKGGSRHKNLCMTRVLGFLIRYFNNYYTLHRSDLAAQAAPLDPRLDVIYEEAYTTSADPE